MDLNLKGKVAIITGGSDGIGKATAMVLQKEGASVVIAARGRERLDAVAAQIRAAGGKVAAIQADVGKAEDCAKLISGALEAFGRIDILINNAGEAAFGEFLATTDETWQADLNSKVFAAIRLARLAIPHMKKQGGGRIINVTNIGSKQPGAKTMPTTISRAAGLAFTKALSKEFAPDNILVNTVCIGQVQSGQHEKRAAKAGIPLEQHYANLGKNIPIGRIGTAEEVGKVITFLVSDGASYVTGSSLNLDGGASAVL